VSVVRDEPRRLDRGIGWTILTRCVAITVAVCMAGQLAWGHSFPPVRTVVVQVERCEVAVLVGFRPGSG